MTSGSVDGFIVLLSSSAGHILVSSGHVHFRAKDGAIIQDKHKERTD